MRDRTGEVWSKCGPDYELIFVIVGPPRSEESSSGVASIHPAVVLSHPLDDRKVVGVIFSQPEWDDCEFERLSDWQKL